MTVQDFVRTVVPPPDWLEKAWTSPKRRGLAALTLDEIEAEIAAQRRSRKDDPAAPGVS